MSTSSAPSARSRRASARPMPLPPPALAAHTPASGCASGARAGLAIGLGPFVGHRGGAREVALELLLALPILHRPFDIAETKLRRCVQRPIRIGEVRARERAQIRATGHENAVDVIGLEDRA